VIDVSQYRGQCQSAYDFLFTNYVNVMHTFSRYSQLFVERCNFFIPNVYLAPPFGVMTPLGFHQDLLHLKTRVPTGYPVAFFAWCYV